jgi:uroporphyrin-3 C-methyltransferase
MTKRNDDTSTTDKPPENSIQPSEIVEVKEKSAVSDNVPIPPITPSFSSKATKAKVSKLALLAIVLTLLLAGFVAFSADHYLKQKKTEQSQVDALLAKQTALLVDVEAKLNAQSQENKQLSDALTNNVQALLSEQQQSQSVLNQKISELSGRRPNDWLLAEANYLVTMAGRKLWQEKDPQTATALLVTAEKRVAEMNDESLISLRQALSKDIATLLTLPKEQSQNIALAIDGLIAQIDNLKLNTVTLPDALEDQTVNKLGVNDDWQDNLKKTWYAFIDGFIKIRKREDNVVPLMSAKQQWYLEENLKNKLVHAQLAVYRKQQQAFHSSVGLSRQWVLQFFDREDSATTFMLGELAKLEKVNITVNYPRDLLSRNMISDELVRRNLSSATTVEQ